jgi:hypothetical protein|tara:strand:- start:2769 stop:3422 length:654 start_codon:yes stop_codon:yes gene_type:complete
MQIEINVPTSLNEITLEQYQKFLKASEETPEGSFLDAKMIEIFCGIPLSDSYKLKMSSVQAIVDILTDMLNQKPAHIDKFSLDGVQYGFIPDLDEMSLGEYVDLDGNASDWQKMHVAMNVLYRPVITSKKGKYNIKEYTADDPEKMKDMPLGVALSSLFFFYNLGLELSKHTILSSSNQAEMEIIQEQLTSEKNGDGTHQFLVSLEGMLESLKISLN